jgi:hypothetical protein
MSVAAVVSTAEPKQTGARRGERLYKALLGKKFEMEAFREVMALQIRKG